MRTPPDHSIDPPQYNKLYFGGVPFTPAPRQGLPQNIIYYIPEINLMIWGSAILHAKLKVTRWHKENILDFAKVHGVAPGSIPYSPVRKWEMGNWENF